MTNFKKIAIGLGATAVLTTGLAWGVSNGSLPTHVATGKMVQPADEGWVLGTYNEAEMMSDNVSVSENFVLPSGNYNVGDEVVMFENRFNEPVATFKSNEKGVEAAEVQLIHEYHYITEVAGGRVKGENIYFGGEGINYPKELFKSFGLDNVKVGDRVDIAWAISDYEDENWDNVAYLKFMTK